MKHILTMKLSKRTKLLYLQNSISRAFLDNLSLEKNLVDSLYFYAPLMAGLPAAAPRLPPGASRQPCLVNQWVQNSESGGGGQEQLSPGSAAAGLSHDHAGSVSLSVASRHGLSIHSALRKLQQAIVKMKTNDKKWEKQIAQKQKSMS